MYTSISKERFNWLASLFKIFIVSMIVLLPQFSYGGKPDIAKMYFSKAEEIHKSNSDGSTILLRQEAYFLSKSIEADPAYFDAWNNLGDVNETLGKYEDALKCYSRAAEFNADSGIAHFGKGDVLLKLGRYDEAIESYEKGLKLKHEQDNVSLTTRRLQSAKILANKNNEPGQIVPKETIVEIMRGAIPDNSSSQDDHPIVIHFGDHLINFDYDKYDLIQKSEKQLDVLIEAMLDLIGTPGQENVSFEIVGHTDERGTIDYNMQLGKNRASAVKNYISSINATLGNKLASKSYGESRPIVASAITQEEHSRNRRVEIKLQNEYKNNEKTAKENNLAINFNVWRINEQGGNIEKQQLVSDKGILYSNDRYQFTVQPNKECYVYIYQKNSKGDGKWLFPLAEKQPENPLKSGKTFWIPSEDDYFQLDRSEGEETIYVVASAMPAYDLEHLIENPSNNGDDEIVRIQVRGLGGIRNMPSNKNNNLISPDPENLTELFSHAGEFFVKLTYIHLENK